MSYIVSVQKLPGEKGKVCSTAGNYCTFQLPRKAKRVYLSAVNAAGRSSPTEVRIYPPKGKADISESASARLEKASDVNCIFVPAALAAISDLTVVPRDDRALAVQWENTDAPSVIGYVVEWRPLLQTDLSLTQFETADRNKSGLIITGTLYSICIADLVCLLLYPPFICFSYAASSFTTRYQTFTS